MLRQKLRITLDTNTLPVDRALEALGDIPADVVVTTVTPREVHGTKWQPELSILQVPEIWVMGESPMGVGALGRPADAEVFEAVLDAISHGTFPKPGKRENLSHGHRNQLRDAAIFATHVRDRRDIFVSDDKKAFGQEGSEQRQRITAIAPETKVMTLPEFERYCEARRAK